MTATRTIADLPGPRGLPLLGNAVQLIPPARVHLKAELWARRYGSMVRVSVGRREMVGIADAATINQILRDRPGGYRRWAEQCSVFDEIAPTGLFGAEGTEWKTQRRLVITALNTNHIHRYYEAVRTCTERLHARLKAAAQSGAWLNITEELTSFTVDVTSWLALGHDLNTLERRDDELQRHFRVVMQTIARRLSAPFPYWRHFKLPVNRRAERSIVAVNQAIRRFVAEARERMDREPALYEEPQNMLEAMIAAQASDGTFTDDQIAGNVYTILLAGEDTTAHTLAWTLSLIGPCPEVQQQLRDEAATELGDRPVAADPQLVNRLRYSEAVVQESMRLRGVSPMLAIEPTNDVTLRDVEVPAGTRLLLLTRQAGRETAGREHDFLPERWLSDSDELRPVKTLGFGAGPRFCPGRNLALLESKTALSMIASSFHIEVDGRRKVREAFEFAIVPRGLRVRLRERAAADQPATSAVAAA